MRTIARALALTVTLALVVPLTALAEDPVWETLPTEDAEAPLLAPTVARVTDIRFPLLALPAFTTAGGSFHMEVMVEPGVEFLASALLAAPEPVLLTLERHGLGPSTTWGDVDPSDPSLWPAHYTAHLPAGVAPGLYDLEVTIASIDPLGLTPPRTDVQVNAVSVVPAARWSALASGAAHPRIVVLADPQVGDPRAFQDAFEEGAADETPTYVGRAFDGTLGDLSDGEDGRWRAIRQAFREARALNPDFVLLAGDLGFGQLVPGSYAAEYEEIWRVLAAADVPLIASMGNHDGYVSNGQDGYAYGRAYVGPTYAMVPTVPGTWVLNMNTYDWSEMDRIGASLAVSAWGGQVREPQMEWIRDSLAGVRAAEPDARVVSVSHHSPSWRQDPYFEADPTGITEAADGYPVVEQVTRGAVSFGTTDQAWSGEGRLELRDLLREFDVEIAFAGHTHIDRVARDDGTGRIVETHQSSWGMPEDYDPRDLHYFTRADGLIPGFTQAELADMMRGADGPFYVETTTVMSGTDQYWGYRVADIAYTPQGDLDLSRLGHPMTQAELDALAFHPEKFNVAHADLGLFSTPLRMDRVAPWSFMP